MTAKTDDLRIFSGRSNYQLAQSITEYLEIPLGEISIRNFADGELWVKYEDNIRGKDVFILQSTNSPAENTIELILMLDAAVRASAKRPEYAMGQTNCRTTQWKTRTNAKQHARNTKNSIF